VKSSSTWAAAAAAVILAGSSATAAPKQDDFVATPGVVNLTHMTPGYSYFNRPGADAATHDADVKTCASKAGRLRSLDEQLNVGASYGLVGAIVGGIISNIYHHGVVAAGLENCMVVLGWRVVHLDDAEGEALAALPPSELAARLEPWIGATEPHGQVVREWGNDAIRASTDRFAIRPGHTNNGQLSLIAATGGNIDKVAALPPPDIKIPKLDKKWPKRPLKPEQVATVPAEGGVILVHLMGVSGKNGTSVAFSRIGPDEATPPSTQDFAPDMIMVAQGTLGAKKEGKLFAVAAPAGRWRISSIGLMPGLNLCLGSPSFEIKPGEVIYAGSFDLSSEDLGPDLSLERPKAWLAGQPAAERVQAAVYTNGSTGLCGDAEMYAMEIKGAPFDPSYHWAGALTSASTVAQPQAAPEPEQTQPPTGIAASAAGEPAH